MMPSWLAQASVVAGRLKELTERGLKVLMLERGKNIIHPNNPTSTKNIWEFPHRGRLTPDDKKQSFVQSRHYSFRDDNETILHQ